MKTSIFEYDDSMQVVLEAETMEEQVQLVRLGMNAKNGNATIETSVSKKDSIDTFINVKKYHNASSYVKKNK